MKKSFCLMAGILFCGLLVQPALAWITLDGPANSPISLDKMVYSYGMFAGSNLNSSTNTLPSPLSVEALVAIPDSYYFALGLSADMMSISNKKIQGESVTLLSQGLIAVAGFWTNSDRDRGVFEKWGWGKLGLHAYVSSGLSDSSADSEAFALSRTFNVRVKIGLGVDWKFKAGQDDADLVLEINGTSTSVGLVPVSRDFTPVKNVNFDNLAVQLGVRVWH